jgi:Trk K+ transport system NAD-binding subunit
MRVEIPSHLVGKPVSSLNLDGKILVAGVDRGGKGFVPVGSSTFQDGDYAAVIVQKDALETLEELLQPIGEH